MPRSLEYFVLRVCERLGISERGFWLLGYESQLRYLAYERLRGVEERGVVG